MKHLFGILTLSLMAACATPVKTVDVKEKALWDGQTFSGWTFIDGSPAASDRWVIEDGTLNSIKSDVKREKDSQSLFTEKSYSNFELVFDFKAQDTANSGIKYLLIPGEKSLPEFQLVHHELGSEASKRGLGSLFDIAAPQNLSNPNQDALQVNEGGWNTGRIVVKGSVVEHWLNGVKIVDLDRCSANFDAQVQESMFKDEPGFAKRAGGKIMLQYNDGGVAFRNLNIKDFGNLNDADSVCGR